MQGTWQVRGRLAMAVAAWIPAAALLAVAPPMVFAQASPGQTQANPGQTHSGPAGSAAFQALAAKATTARDAERLDEAVPLFRKALALNPKWAEGWWSLGTIEYDRNQYDAAAREFQKLLPLAPKDGTARAMLGLCEFEMGQDEAALRNLQEGRALGLATDLQLQEVVLYHEGTLLLRAAQFKVAQTTFGMFCKLDTGNVQMMEGMGQAVLRISPKQAPAAGSTNSEVVRRVGNAACLTATKRFDEANRQYAMLLNDCPDFRNIHYAFGLSLVESNDVPGAVEQFKIQIQQDPKNAEARLEIAAALYKVDSSAALPYAQDAVSLNPQQPFAHYLLGLLLLDTDDYLKAIPELEIAAKAFPREKKVFFALGSAYSRAGRRQEAANARATFERLDKESPSDSSSSY
jgi:tetratricopeptide (TPR) repeat protein